MGEELLRLRAPQALEGRPAGRNRRRSGPGGPSHAPYRASGEPPGRRSASPPRPTRPRSGHRTSCNRNFTASRPDALWVADFTYCSTWSGVVYVAFIIDVYSRRLVGWKAARSMTTALVLDALNMAAWTRRHTTLDGLICHTDAGSQYTSVLYTDRIDEVGAAPSIGTVGDSYDNAMAESVMGIFKTELHRNPAALAANGGPWKGLDDLEIATCAWVSWFNEERLHSELDDRTPAEVEAEYRHKSQPDAA